MKLIIGNFKNNLDFKNTKALLNIYQASFLHAKVGFCVKQEYFYELNFEDYSNLNIFCNNIDLNKINKNVNNKNYLIGHLDSRIKGETNKLIVKKTNRLLKYGATVLLCIGESFDEFNAGLSTIALKKQLKGVKPNKNLIIAYEPFYSIGSNSPAFLSDVLKNVKFIKKIFNNSLVLYGGSINLNNAFEFLNSDLIDGVLVGRSSLNAKEFCKIVNLIKK